MAIDATLKAKIDEMSYEELLRLNRFGDLGDPIFQEETGDYFIKVMAEKKAALMPGEAVAISKRVGLTKK